MKPIIGITSNLKDGVLSVSTDNIYAITEAGGIPIVLPNLVPSQGAADLIAAIDGLLVTGGGDLDPLTFGEEPIPALGSVCPERDLFEIYMIKEIAQLNKPILAICRGCQVLNVALGGDIYQDIYSQAKEPLLQHSQMAPRWHGSHMVNVNNGTLLYRITGAEQFKVNSFHHQAVRKIGRYLTVSAVSNDGLIEAIESTRNTFVIGVQWHPENMIVSKDPHAELLFRYFIDACKK